MKIYKVAQLEDPEDPEEYGYNLTSDSRVAEVNWNESDVQILDKWTERNVRKFLSLPDDAVIYTTLADISDLNESLAEENLEDDEEEYGESGGYDWSELQRMRTLPPPVLITRTKDNNVVINDGNHRIHFWREQGKEYIPAWCYDELLTEWYRANPENGDTR